MASGRLRSKPIIKPFTQGATGKFVLAIKKPIAKRPINEASIATALSFIGIGIIKSTSRIPNTNPAIIPLIKLSIYKQYTTSDCYCTNNEYRFQFSIALRVWNTFSYKKIDQKKLTYPFSFEKTICEPTVPQVEHLIWSILKTYERLISLGFTYYNGKVIVIDTGEISHE